jgi:hypothetical protein
VIACSGVGDGVAGQTFHNLSNDIVSDVWARIDRSFVWRYSTFTFVHLVASGEIHVFILENSAIVPLGSNCLGKMPAFSMSGDCVNLSAQCLDDISLREPEYFDVTPLT